MSFGADVLIGGPDRQEQPTVVRCTIVIAPATRTDTIGVVPIGGSSDQLYEIPSSNWEPLWDASLPVVGAACVVVVDHYGDVWLVGAESAGVWPPVTTGIVNVKTYGAAGDGSTDDTGALTAFINAINATTGTAAVIPAGTYKITSALPAITKPVQLIGAASGIVPATAAGTVLKFSAGVPGLQLAAAAQLSKISGLYLQSASSVLGTDDGISVLSHGTILENLVFDGFGRDGVHIDTSVSGNANNSVLRNVRCVNGKRDGFRLVGTNSNVITLDTCDATANAGWGYNVQTAQCVLTAPHADSNTLGAYTDTGSSNLYLMPYSEGGTGNNVTLGGAYCIWLQGFYTTPTITKADTNIVVRHGGFDTSLDIYDGTGGGHTYRFSSGSYSAGYFALSDQTGSRNIFDVDGAGTRAEWLIPLLLAGGINGTAGTASPVAGGAGALPATPAGYLTVKINGVNRQVPYY